MANPELVERLKQGARDWNTWRSANHDVYPDLSEADLHEANLFGANLDGVELCLANLTGAYLDGADLSQANLREAYLGAAYLDGANLTGTYLGGTDLSYAILGRANLHNAIVEDTVFAHVDLREVKGLAQINHRRPSRVVLHTILLPQDGSALHFLCGVGVPDEWIDFWRTTMMHPIQYHSCFISYSSRDEILARRLHVDLQANGIRCWFAPEDLKTGDQFRQRIDDAIHLQEKLLLLLSRDGIESPWVKDEVEAAVEKEHRQHCEVLFPIRLDDAVIDTPKAWAAKLRRTSHIGDFTHWADPLAYQSAFDRLLRDLKQN